MLAERLINIQNMFDIAEDIHNSLEIDIFFFKKNAETKLTSDCYTVAKRVVIQS